MPETENKLKQQTYIDPKTGEFSLPVNQEEKCSSEPVKLEKPDWYRKIKTSPTVPHWTEKAYDK